MLFFSFHFQSEQSKNILRFSFNCTAIHQQLPHFICIYRQKIVILQLSSFHFIPLLMHILQMDFAQLRISYQNQHIVNGTTNLILVKIACAVVEKPPYGNVIRICFMSFYLYNRNKPCKSIQFHSIIKRENNNSSLLLK